MIDIQSTPFTKEQANAVYDILVKCCRAPDSERDRFLFSQTEEGPPNEWRFGGMLGMGGKLWRNDDRLYVNAYKEDRTDLRDAAITDANTRLAKLMESWE